MAVQLVGLAARSGVCSVFGGVPDQGVEANADSAGFEMLKEFAELGFRAIGSCPKHVMGFTMNFLVAFPKGNPADDD